MKIIVLRHREMLKLEDENRLQEHYRRQIAQGVLVLKDDIKIEVIECDVLNKIIMLPNENAGKGLKKIFK